MPVSISGSGSITGVSTLTQLATLDVTGAVSVGGTLTYEDVTNIDAVGVITARSGIHVTGGNIRLTGTSGFTELQAPAVAGSNTLVLPDSNGSSGQLLQTDGAGNLDWTGDYTKLDTAQTFTKGQRGEVTALVDGANIAIDLNDSNHFAVTLAGNRTLDNPSNMTPGQSGSIIITQDGTGSRTLSYGGFWKFPGAVVPTLTTTGGRTDILSYFVISSTQIVGVLLSDVR